MHFSHLPSAQHLLAAHSPQQESEECEQDANAKAMPADRRIMNFFIRLCFDTNGFDRVKVSQISSKINKYVVSNRQKRIFFVVESMAFGRQGWVG